VHHIRFAQARALDRKVSDEYTVPVCRLHHRELHRYGDEASWWAAVGVDPLPIALLLWRKTHFAAQWDFPKADFDLWQGLSAKAPGQEGGFGGHPLTNNERIGTLHVAKKRRQTDRAFAEVDRPPRRNEHAHRARRANDFAA
jgi:hypothetical protein